MIVSANVCLICYKISGLVRDLNPGPRAPEARIIPLDQRAGARNRCLRITTLLTRIVLCAWRYFSQHNFRTCYRTSISHHVVVECPLHAGTVQQLQREVKRSRARPGFEPGTSRTQSENHTPRPTSHR